MMHVSRLLLGVVLALPAAAQDALPTFPGPEWVALAPDQVKAAADFEQFKDVFEAKPPGAAWESSPVWTEYATLEDLPEALTLEQVRDHLAAVRQRFALSARFESSNGPVLRRRLLAELDRLLGDVEGLARPAEPASWDRSKSFISNRFQVTSGDWEVEGEQYGSDVVFFPNRPTQIVLYVDKEVVEDVGGMEVSRWEPDRYYATLDQAIEIRTAVARVQALFGKLSQPAFDRLTQRLGEIDAGWTNYLEKGFSQYPWEAWTNSRLTDFAWSRPPVSQWVLLHPEVGLVFDTRSTRAATTESALLVHGLGYLRYFGDERDWFLGLSASAALTGDEAYGWGVGPTLHVGHTRVHSRVPHLSAGIIWFDFEDGDDRPVLLLSLDLWRLVDQGRDALYQRGLTR